MTAEPLLKVRDLAVDFLTSSGWSPAVASLSFEMGERETLAIVGESGSGKSVAMLSLLQLLPTANSRVGGEAHFRGRNLLALGESEIRRVRGREIAMIFQEPMTSLNPVLTIGDQLIEAIQCHRPVDRAEARGEALDLLDRVRIPAARQRLDEYPHRLSGGMRQRVMIAMALSGRPRILIADEPTTALDVTVQAQILELLRTLQADFGMSVLFITHDMGVVAETADRVLVMLRGNKVEEATAISLFETPAHRYTRRLLAAAPVLGSMSERVGPIRFRDIDADQSAEDRQEIVQPGTNQTLLEVKSLTKRFDVRSGAFRRVAGRVHAVENVSFTVSTGETLALVGESGCGKSTLGRTILQLERPCSGALRFAGLDLLSLDRKKLAAARRMMQVVFQDPVASLDPRMTAGDAIAEPIIVHRLADREEARRRALALLEKVGLGVEMAQRLPHEFSGGQKQRVCIARALSLEPRLIVADEAVSALDVSVKAQVLNLLLDLQRDMGLSFLFISHDMATVERVSHRIAVMYLGEIVEIGPRQAVIGNPQHPYTRKLLSAAPIPDPRRRGTRPPAPIEDLPSPIRKLDYRPPPQNWRKVSDDHFVQEPREHA